MRERTWKAYGKIERLFDVLIVLNIVHVMSS